MHTSTAKPVSTVYYFPIDGEGHEIGEPSPITLKPDGQADLSHLPESMREFLTVFGAPSITSGERLYPKDGAEFLSAILRLNNGYLRFRLAPKKIY